MEDTPLEISCGELHSRMQAREAIVLIDCREQHEYDLVRLPGARLVPLGEIPARAAEFESIDGPLVVYCHHGMRSGQAAAWLRANGAPHAQSLAGGVEAWAVQIDPSLPRY